jgi:regulator of RNase E activity RraA
VTVAGLAVETGDLLVADRHGVLRIPPEIPIEEIVEAGREIDRLEAEIFACTKSRDFSIEMLEQVQESVLARWPRGPHTGAR